MSAQKQRYELQLLAGLFVFGLLALFGGFAISRYFCDSSLFWLIVGIAVFLVAMFAVFLSALLLQNILKLDRRLKQRDELLLQESKMAEVGGMISFVGHQWRQPLNRLASIIMIVKDELMREQFDPKELQSDLREGESVVMHLSSALELLSDFYSLPVESSEFGVQECVLDAMTIVEHRGAKLGAKIHLEGEDSLVYGKKSQLSQAILSILNNMFDAFEIRKRSQPAITIKTSISEEWVVIECTDNAGGVEDGMLKHLFERYSSDKQALKGSGIGLYFAKVIVQERFRGSIDVENRGEGAHFTIRLGKNLKRN